MHFKKITDSESIIACVTTDYFLVSVPTDTLIDEFKSMLADKYTIRDLFHPSKYLGRTIRRQEDE